MSNPLTPRILPLHLPRICVALQAPTATELFAKAEAAIRDNPFMELRLDYLKQQGAPLFQKLRRFADYHPEALLIATCRRTAGAGKFRGSLASQIDVLVKAAASGCQFIDLELESVGALKSKDLDRLRAAATVIVSFHDFRATRKLEQTFRKMSAFPADYYKVVSTAGSLYDNVLMMKFLERESDKHSMIGLCMGEQGIISRVLCVRAGSVFTFASANPGEETAPGQIAVRTLRDTYRLEQVDAATRIYGVAGDPVAHSLSPLMMNSAFRRENVNAVYLALHATTIADLMSCVRDIPLHGLSVTMPYKQAIISYLDNTDAVTEKIGACNTVIRAQDGKLYGYNTDVAGIVRPLEQRLHLNGAKVLVVGAGGAGRAAVFGLKERGAQVFIANRTAAAGQKLARQAHARFLSRTQMRDLEFDVIVNATPVGMNGSRVSPLGEKELNARILLEMVYTPAETPLVKMARAKGIEVITGAEMFVQQGARQFEIWTGKPAPAEDMYRVVTKALAERAASRQKNSAPELAAS